LPGFVVANQTTLLADYCDGRSHVSYHPAA